MALSEKPLAEAIRAARGNLSTVAKRFQVTRQAVQNYISRRPKLKEVMSEARESMLDMVESSLYKACRKGQGWAVCFFLKTQGKDRGYIERIDHLPPIEMILALLPAAVREIARGELAKALPAGPDSGAEPGADGTTATVQRLDEEVFPASPDAGAVKPA